MPKKSLINLPPRSTREGDSVLLGKAQQMGRAVQPKISGKGTLMDRIKNIEVMVQKELGQYADQLELIRDKDVLISYIDTCVANKMVAVDTETEGLNPLLDRIAGICLYSPEGVKPCYIPLNHISYITSAPVKDQLPIEFVSKQLERLKGCQIDMFNGDFDYRVLKNSMGVLLPPTWDCYIGARLLNENEGDGANKLKILHRKYCKEGMGGAFTFDTLFSGIPFTYIPLKTAYLYAALDPKLTYELSEYQRGQFADPDLEDLKKLFLDVEMPLVEVVADMEDTGIAVDVAYIEALSKKYNEELTQREAEFYKICDAFGDKLDAYRAKMGTKNKLEYPINIGSNQQIAIMIYDVLEIEQPKVRNKGSRSVDEDVLSRIDHPVVKAILHYRELVKLIGTYVDKMLKVINPKTGRVHCNFNSVGTDTGRFSSREPNMQNIPAKNTEIRPMFVASDGYVLISADYSAQEPRLTAHMSQDERMIQAYVEGKDLYVEIASIAYGLPYDECKEFRADGTKNPDGKKRRSAAKAIVLGVCYGKGIKAIAEDLKISVTKAQEIYDKIMEEFPGLRQFMVDSENMAKNLGYVTTILGRRRRLPDIQLPKYEFSYNGDLDPEFDPLDFDSFVLNEPPQSMIQKYTKLLDNCKYWQKRVEIKERAKAEGLMIKENGGFIAQATRQCVNSRIQGGAGDQIKKAMNIVYHDEILKSYHFRLLLQVHDELIGECPEENAELAAARLKYLMEGAIADILSVPSICDTEITRRWGGEVVG